MTYRLSLHLSFFHLYSLIYFAGWTRFHVAHNTDYFHSFGNHLVQAIYNMSNNLHDPSYSKTQRNESIPIYKFNKVLGV